jgi:hypothetical protein
MNRSNPFLSGLLLIGTIAGPTLSAHPSKPAAEGANKGGKGSASGTTLRNDRAVGKRGPEVGRLQPERKEVHIAERPRSSFDVDDHTYQKHERERDIHHDREEWRERRRERPDHSILVTTRGGHGYIERSYTYHGHDFDHRTYYEHGVAYTRFYQPYDYRGIRFHVYAPRFYYAPAFYGWAYAPWAAPVAWDWGWYSRPWYGYYGAWFRPYPVYTSPSLWLTDYLLAKTLQAAYEERIAASRVAVARLDAQAAASTPMTPEVKQAIAEEVRRQLALENAEAAARNQGPPDPGSSGLARMLSDKAPHVFVVSTSLDVMSGAGACPLTEGDVIQLSGPAAPNSVTANLMVLASKGNDCRRGSFVTVGLAELQEMQNHMRETIDLGLSELQSKQGKGGLPAVPPAAAKPPVQTEFAAIAPPPDPNGESEIRQQVAQGAYGK